LIYSKKLNVKIIAVKIIAFSNIFTLIRILLHSKKHVSLIGYIRAAPKVILYYILDSVILYCYNRTWKSQKIGKKV